MQTSAKIIIISIIVAVLAGTWAYKNTSKTAELPEPSTVTTHGMSIISLPEKEITTKTTTTVTSTYGETKEDIIKNTKMIEDITTLDRKTGKKTFYTKTTIKKKNKNAEGAYITETNPIEIK